MSRILRFAFASANSVRWNLWLGRPTPKRRIMIEKRRNGRATIVWDMRIAEVHTGALQSQFGVMLVIWCQHCSWMVPTNAIRSFANLNLQHHKTIDAQSRYSLQLVSCLAGECFLCCSMLARNFYTIFRGSDMPKNHWKEWISNYTKRVGSCRRVRCWKFSLHI